MPDMEGEFVEALTARHPLFRLRSAGKPGVGRMEARLRRILQDFRIAPMEEVLDSLEKGGRPPSAALPVGKSDSSRGFAQQPPSSATQSCSTAVFRRATIEHR